MGRQAKIQESSSCAKETCMENWKLVTLSLSLFHIYFFTGLMSRHDAVSTRRREGNQNTTFIPDPNTSRLKQLILKFEVTKWRGQVRFAQNKRIPERNSVSRFCFSQKGEEKRENWKTGQNAQKRLPWKQNQKMKNSILLAGEDYIKGCPVELSISKRRRMTGSFSIEKLQGSCVWTFGRMSLDEKSPAPKAQSRFSFWKLDSRHLGCNLHNSWLYCPIFFLVFPSQSSSYFSLIVSSGNGAKDSNILIYRRVKLFFMKTCFPPSPSIRGGHVSGQQLPSLTGVRRFASPNRTTGSQLQRGGLHWLKPRSVHLKRSLWKEHIATQPSSFTTSDLTWNYQIRYGRSVRKRFRPVPSWNVCAMTRFFFTSFYKLYFNLVLTFVEKNWQYSL